MKRTAHPCMLEPLEDRCLLSATDFRLPSPPPSDPSVAEVSVSVTHTAEGTHIPKVIITTLVDVDTAHPVTLYPPISNGIIAVLIGM